MMLGNFMPYFVKSDKKEVNFPTLNNLFRKETMKELDEEMIYLHHLFVT